MGLLRRIGLFILTNIVVIFLFSVVLMLLNLVFGIDVSAMSGQSIGGLILYASIFGFIGSFFSLFISRWTAKRAYGITPFTQDKAYNLKGKEKLVYDTVVRIAQDNGIKTPEVGVYDSSDPNAFATGARKNASLVAVSSGLLNHMNEDQIEAVVAHEMAHILNGDMVTMALLQGVVNTFVIAIARLAAEAIKSRMGEDIGIIAYNAIYMILQLIFGVFASVIVMGFSRWREYRADAGSSRFVGKEKMISALRALEKMQDMAPKGNSKMATMQISTRKSGGFMKLFMSHPPLEKRIAYLENITIKL